MLMAIFPESLKEGFCFNAFNTILSCRVDIGKNEDIGVIKRSEKIFKQGLSSAVTVGLKYCNDPFPPTGSCRLECSHNLYRMVAIIIHDENPLLLSFDLKPSLNPAQIPRCLLDDLEGNIQFKGCG